MFFQESASKFNLTNRYLLLSSLPEKLLMAPAHPGPSVEDRVYDWLAKYSNWDLCDIEIIGGEILTLETSGEDGKTTLETSGEDGKTTLETSGELQV
jgi:hypothetical protein